MNILKKKKNASFETAYMMGTPFQRFIREWGGFIGRLGSFACLYIIFFGVIFRFGVCRGSSMEPTLSNGEIVLFQRMNISVDYGDIITVQRDSLEHMLIKRVIGKAGDTIEIDIEQGVVYRNGVALNEPYIAEPTKARGHMSGPVTVKEGCYFVMGDNRMNSLDSRFDSVGLVSENEIEGKLLTVLFNPFDWGTEEV